MNSEQYAKQHTRIQSGGCKFLDRTGNMVRPWAEAGYPCWCYDIQHQPEYHQNAEDNNIWWIGYDLATGCAAPCQHTDRLRLSVMHGIGG